MALQKPSKVQPVNTDNTLQRMEGLGRAAQAQHPVLDKRGCRGYRSRNSYTVISKSIFIMTGDAVSRGMKKQPVV
jgi:hypothetical protein